MIVEIISRNDPERPITDPLPELTGRRFVHRVYAGDVLMPVFGTFFGEQWFGPNFPKLVIRGWLTRGHFFAFRWPFTKRAGYIGWKCYGVDRPEYTDWPYGVQPGDVFEGSLALVLTARFAARI